MNWDLVFTVLFVGLAGTLVVALLGSVIVALQIAKFNTVRKALREDSIVIEDDFYIGEHNA